MFLSKISARRIAQAEGYVSYFGKQTYDYLKAKGYRLYYFYDVSTDSITYVAIAKVMKDCYLHLAEPFLAFTVYSDGRLIATNEATTSPFLLYLFENEKSLSEEERRRIYKEVYSISELTDGLNSVDAAQKMEDRKAFEDFLSKLGKTKEAKNAPVNSDKVGAFLSFYYEKSEYYEQFEHFIYGITLIDHQKNCEIKDLYKFCTGFATRAEFPLSTKRRILLEPNSFFPPYDSALPLLAGASHFENKRKTSMKSLSLEKVTPILECLLDEPLEFNDERIRIQKKDPVSFSLNEKGVPSFTPKRLSGSLSKTLLGKKGIFEVDGNKNTISFYPFPSPEMREAYLYFTEDKLSRFSYIQDLFNEQLLPKLSSSLKKVETKKEGEKKPFEIVLYLSIDEGKGLQFKTLYYENGEQVKEVKSPLGQSLKTAYLSLLSSLGGIENGSLKKEDDVVAFLSKDLTPLLNLVTFYCDERLKAKNIARSVSSLRLKAKRNGDYLSLTLDSEAYSPEDLAKILLAYKQKKKYYLLKDGLLFLNGKELQEASSLMEGGNLSNDKVPLYKLFSLDSSSYKIEEDEGCKKVLNSIKDFKGRSTPLSKEALKILRPYQLDGVKYLLSLHDYSFGGILADEMGLGKTVEAISYMASLKEEMPILIIAPKAVLYNWESEIHKFSSLPCIVIDANKEAREKTIKNIKKNKKVLYCVSYDTFKRDEELFSSLEFSTLILDEAQSIKNSLSKRHQALLSLKAKNKIALTGTPLENSPFDLWSIFNILMPGYLGDEKEFGEPLKLDDSSKRLALLLKPFMLRRRKADVLKDLPEKSENNILISSSESERMLYLAYLEKARALQGENKISILASLTRLRQLCVDPSSFLENVEPSTKLLYARELLKETIANGHKAIVFSSFKTALLDLEELLDEEGIATGIITGDTAGKERLALAENFNTKDEIKIMLVSLKAGGVGLNLIGADTVIHLDPWWNPQVENQASDRVHRIGQTHPVSILRLVMKDTIEEKVLNLQQEKKDLYDEIVEGNGGASSLSEEDIKYLLS